MTHELLTRLPVGSLEFVLLALALLLFLFDLFLKDGARRLIPCAAVLGLLGLFALLCLEPGQWIGTGFGGLYSVVRRDILFKAVFVTGGLFSILIAGSRRGHHEKIPYFLICLGLFGAFSAASSGELLTLFLSIEILAFASYVLVACAEPDARSAEAGLKYLILGTLAACFFLFGIACLYGAAGSTKLSVIQMKLEGGVPPLAALGLCLITAGILFKIGAFPFHFWIPDVYEASPAWLGGFLSVVSKAAGFAALGKILPVFQPVLGTPLSLAFGLLSILTVLYGNLGALRQENLGRFMGYSTIAQAGYLLLALTNLKAGMRPVLFYLFVYAASNLLAFLAIFLSGRRTRSETPGVARENPLAALSFFIALVSLAGIPPAAGFVGKFLLFLAAFEVRALLAIAIALAGILISIFYYFRLIRAVYADRPVSERRAVPKTETLTVVACLTSCILIAIILGLGIFPAPLLKIIY